jgi:hypothetical protein
VKKTCSKILHHRMIKTIAKCHFRTDSIRKLTNMLMTACPKMKINIRINRMK